jgi:hypothetical protein
VGQGFSPARDAARALLERVVAAKGGLSRLRGIHTVVAAAVTTVQTPSGSVTSETTTYVEYPSRFRVEARTPRGDTVQVYADGHAWVKGPGGVETVPPDSLARFRAPVERDVISLLVRASDGTLRVAIPRPAGTPPRASAPPLLLEFSGDGADSVMLSVDPASGLVLELRYVEQQGPVAQAVREVFSDYRPVDGVMVAFEASIRSGETTFAERRLREIRFNVPVAAALFERPR